MSPLLLRFPFAHVHIQFLIINLNPKQVTLEQLARLRRWHGTNEDATHYPRASTVRTGSPAKNPPRSSSSSIVAASCRMIAAASR